MTTAVNVFP